MSDPKKTATFGEIAKPMPARCYAFFLTALFGMLVHVAVAQKIPKNPNKLEGSQRQGKWTLLFDKNWKEIGEASEVAYYRLIEYQNGNPTGTVRDYFADGRIQWEGQLLSENPDVNTGVCTWYNEDGTKQRESAFVNGKREGKEVLYFQGKKYAEGTYSNEHKNLDWIYYGSDYNSLSAVATQFYQRKEYEKAGPAFKKTLSAAIENYGTSSVQYRDTRWWMYYVYSESGNIPEAVAALRDAARASAVIHDEFEIRVVEDAEKYADNLKNDKKYDAAISLYQLAARAREQRNWLSDASYYKDLKGILDSQYWLDKTDSLHYYFEKIATVIAGERTLGKHLYDWASYSIGSKQPAYFSKIEKACEVYLRDREQKNQKDAGYSEAWLAFGKIQQAKGQYERALKSYADARAALNAEENQKIYYNSLSLSAGCYNESKKYDANARTIFETLDQWTDRFAEYLGATYIDNLTEVVRYGKAVKDYPLAEKTLVKMLPAAEKQYGKGSAEYKVIAATLSNIYELQGKTDLAKANGQNLSTSDQEQIANFMGVGSSNNDPALLQEALAAGRFAEAVQIFERSYQMMKTYYEQKQDYEGLVLISSGVATCYQQTGDLYKAGQLLLETKKLADAHLSKASETYQNMLLTLGDYYAGTGRFKDADETFYSGMEALNKARTPANAKKNDELYYRLAERLAGLYARWEYFRDSERLYYDVLAYREKTTGKNSLHYQFTATELADLYQRMHMFVRAAELYEEAMPVIRREMGEKSFVYIDASRNLANIYLLNGNYAASENAYLTAKTFYQSAMGARSEGYRGVLADLGLLYTYSGQWAKAAPIYHDQVALNLEQVRNLFPLLSEKEKADFYSLARSQFNTYNVFAMHQLNEVPAEAGEMYNLQLVSKSLLFKATDRVRTSVLNSKDEGLKEVYSRWKTLRDQLSKVYQLSAEQKKTSGIDEKQLEKTVNELERELTVKSELFARLISDNPDWKAIRTALRPGEAAVEVVRIVEALPEFTFDYIGKGITIDTLDAEGYARVNNLEVKCSGLTAGLRVGETILSINNQPTKGKSMDDIIELLRSNPARLVVRKKNSKATYTAEIKSDSVFYRSYPKKVRYVALIITPDAQTPKPVIMLNGDAMETKYAKFYRNAITHQVEDLYSYPVFWQPLQDALTGVKKIYFSPDGVYNTINPNTLYNPDTKRYVLDDTELVLVSNTADILRQAVPSASKKAVLVGFPDYNKAGTSALKPSEFTLLKKDSAQRFMNGNTVTELPGTRTEVNAIETLLKPKLEVTKYMAAEASEEKMKAMDAPKLLHIATHGFFLDDISGSDEGQRGVTGIANSTLAENPLLRSGLLLAGAGKTISEGRQGDQTEDGVLTAFEAMNLNLNQTDMVVLSACETGLGQVQTGEGVYGLQRAFRAAGAQSVLMSLWKVDDQATQKLMTGFYSEWLSKGKKQMAFREAQLTLRRQFPHPYYWGAFVLMGE